MFLIKYPDTFLIKYYFLQLMHKTKTLSHTTNPVWNHKFDFDEIGGGECLMIKCYNADIFGDENIGSARVNLDGLVEGSCKDVWIPLEKVNSGELRLLIEALNNEDFEVSRVYASSFFDFHINIQIFNVSDGLSYLLFVDNSQSIWKWLG